MERGWNDRLVLIPCCSFAYLSRSFAIALSTDPYWFLCQRAKTMQCRGSKHALNDALSNSVCAV